MNCSAPVPLSMGILQESNWGLLHGRQIPYQLSYQGSPTCCLPNPSSPGPWESSETHRYSHARPLTPAMANHLGCSPPAVSPASLNQTQCSGSPCRAGSAGVACEFAQTGTSFLHRLWPEEFTERGSKQQMCLAPDSDSAYRTQSEQSEMMFLCVCVWVMGAVPPCWLPTPHACLASALLRVGIGDVGEDMVTGEKRQF